MSDLASFKIKLADLISPQLKKIQTTFGLTTDAAKEFEKETNKGINKTKSNLSQLNMIGRLGNARNGLAAFTSSTKLAAMGINPIIAGLGLATVGALKLGSTLLENSKQLQTNLETTSLLLGTNTKETKALTAQATALTKVYGGEYLDTVQTASKLSKDFGITNEQALELIKKGFASGANVSGNMLQLLSESSNAFKNLGATADQQIAIVQQSITNGVEDAPRLLESFNKNLPNLGEDVKRLLDINFGKGFTSTLKKNLENGKTTAIDALKSISTAVANTEMVAGSKESLAAQLFGDESGSAVTLLGNFAKFDTSLSNLVAKNSQYNNSKSQQLQLEERLAATQLISSQGFENLSNKATIFGLNMKIALYDGINLFSSIFGEIGRVVGAVGGFIFRIAKLSGGVWILKTTWDAVSEAVVSVWNIFSGAVTGIFGLIGDGFTFANNMIDKFLNSNPIAMISNAFNGFNDIISKSIGYIESFFGFGDKKPPITKEMLSKPLQLPITAALKDSPSFKNGLPGLGGSGTPSKEVNNKLDKQNKTLDSIAKNNNQKELFHATGLENSTKTETQSKLSNGMESIVAGGKEVRNVSVTVQKMVAIETLNSTVAESINDATKSASDLLVRILQGAETAFNKG